MASGKENKEIAVYDTVKGAVNHEAERKVIFTQRKFKEMKEMFTASPIRISSDAYKEKHKVGRRLEEMLKMLRSKSGTPCEDEVVKDHLYLPAISLVEDSNGNVAREFALPAQLPEFMKETLEKSLEDVQGEGNTTEVAPNVEDAANALKAITLMVAPKVEIDQDVGQSELEEEENLAQVEPKVEMDLTVTPKVEVEHERQIASGVHMEVEVGEVKFEYSNVDGDHYAAESEKEETDIARLSEEMIRTYKARKPLYDSCRVSVAKLRLFPDLKHYLMIKQEYCLIRSDLKKMEKLEDKLSKIFSLALESAANSMLKLRKKQGYQWWSKALQLWKKTEQTPIDRKLIGIVAICIELVGHKGFNGMCRILQQDTKLLKKEEKLLVNPTIVVQEADILEDKSRIRICADKTTFFEAPNIYEAVLSVYASYYILNYVYPPALKPLFEFFDLLNDNIQYTYKSTSDCMWPPETIDSPRQFYKR